MAAASQKPTEAKFSVGDLVRVGAAEVMPAGSPSDWHGAIDGAEGVISEITRDPKTRQLQYHVALNRATIDRMPEDYLRDCRQRRLQPSLLILDADQLDHHDWSSTDAPTW